MLLWQGNTQLSTQHNLTRGNSRTHSHALRDTQLHHAAQAATSRAETVGSPPYPTHLCRCPICCLYCQGSWVPQQRYKQAVLPKVDCTGAQYSQAVGHNNLEIWVGLWVGVSFEKCQVLKRAVEKGRQGDCGALRMEQSSQATSRRTEEVAACSACLFCLRVH